MNKLNIIPQMVALLIFVLIIGSVIVSCNKSPNGPDEQNEPSPGINVSTINFDNAQNTKIIKLFNTGGGTLSWSLTINGSFLIANVYNGSITTDTAYITLTVNPSSNQLVGIYNETLQFMFNNNKTLTVNVVYNNNAFPISFSTPKLMFSNKGSGQLRLRGFANTQFSWSISQKPQWLSIIPSSGVLATDSVTLTVQVDTSIQLNNGINLDTIKFAASNFIGSVAASLEILPIIAIDSMSITFDRYTNTKSFRILNIGRGTLHYIVSRDNGGLINDWINSISDSIGTIAGAGSKQITITVNRSLLPAGSFRRNILFSSDNNTSTYISMLVEDYKTMPDPVVGVWYGVTTNSYGSGTIQFTVNPGKTVSFGLVAIKAYIDGQVTVLNWLGNGTTAIVTNQYGGKEIHYRNGNNFFIDGIFTSANYITSYYRAGDGVGQNPQPYVSAFANFYASY